jgi:hypothetical protein
LGKSPSPRFASAGAVLSADAFRIIECVGAILEGYDFFGAYIDGDWRFMSSSWEPLMYERLDAAAKLFSRNYGLLESGYMQKKRAVMIGCGSVGSYIALELARSGIGKFSLIDSDELEVHNICRHQCGFDDLGRLKTDAVRDRILNINPKAEVETFPISAQDVSKNDWDRILDSDAIVIGGGDNRESSAFGCDLAAERGAAFLSACCWTRAHAGEIYYWLPGRDMICCRCAFNGILSSERPDSNHAYIGEDDLELFKQGMITFEPGVSVDINFISNIALKLILDIVNIGNGAYTPRVINYLKQYTLVCNTNEPHVGGPKAAIFSHPLQITTNLALTGARLGCPHCSHLCESVQIV